MLKLTTQTRTKNDTLNADDLLIAGVMYGNGIPSISLYVNRLDFTRVYKEAGTATIINLETESGTKTALIHDLKRDPKSHKFTHIDFYLVDATHEIEVGVPLHFIGEAPAEKDSLGNLIKSLHEVEVKCLPSDLPSHFDIDISSLITLSDNIFVKNIMAPKGVTIVTKGDIVIASIAEAMEEKETVVMDLETIESEKKGKKEVKE